MTSVYDDFGRERQVASPDAGTNASVYDEAGNLVSRSNALGERAEFFWDALNRPVRLQWPGAARAGGVQLGSGYGWASDGDTGGGV